MVEEKSELSMESLAEERPSIRNSRFRVRRHWQACHLYYDVQHAGMINTLITNIVTKKQELAVLRVHRYGKGADQKNAIVPKA